MISLSNITKQYGTQVLYRGGSFQIRPGDRIAFAVEQTAQGPLVREIAKGGA